MCWKRTLAYITGSIDQELLLRNEVRVTENHLLHTQTQGRLRLTDPDRISLAQIGKRLGRKALQEVAHIVKPDPILVWHCRLVARKFDGSKRRRPPGRPCSDLQIEDLFVRMARESRTLGYDRIVGALANLEPVLSGAQRRPGRSLSPHPWTFCRPRISSPRESTAFGLVTYYCLFFFKLATREIQIARITTSPG